MKVYYVLLMVLVALVQGYSGEMKLSKPLNVAPLKIDGKPGKPVWEKAERVRFSLLEADDKPAKQPTVFSIAHDGTNLYFWIECYESRINYLKADHFEKDSDVWKDDCVEIFITPKLGQRPYYQFVMNCKGVGMDGKEFNRGWNGVWTGKTSVGSNAWYAEIAIPLATLKATVGTNTIMGLNVCRERYAGEAEFSSWSIMEGAFHNPERFGALVFGDDTEGWRNDMFDNWFRRRTEVISEEMKKMEPKVAGSMNKQAKLDYEHMRNVLNEINMLLDEERANRKLSFDQLFNMAGKIARLLDEYEHVNKCLVIQLERSTSAVIKI